MSHERRLSEKGYWLTPAGYLEHRRIYKRNYGKIPIGYHVHHIDQCKTNNAVDNLIAMPGKCHNDLHSLMRQNNLRFDRKQTIEFIENWIKKKPSYPAPKYLRFSLPKRKSVEERAKNYKGFKEEMVINRPEVERMKPKVLRRSAADAPTRKVPRAKNVPACSSDSARVLANCPIKNASLKERILVTESDEEYWFLQLFHDWKITPRRKKYPRFPSQADSHHRTIITSKKPTSGMRGQNG